MQINITESTSPVNAGTIDMPNLGKTGNSYTKDQVNKKLSEASSTNIVGEAKPDTVPTPWIVGSEPLFEIYKVKTVGFYNFFRDQYDEGLTVTSIDFANGENRNLIEFWVKNGVASKQIIELPKSSVNIRRWQDLQSSDFPLIAGYQIEFSNSFWKVADGKTVSSLDVPSDSSDKWVLIGGSVKAINDLNLVLKSFSQDETTSGNITTTFLPSVITSDGVITANASHSYTKIDNALNLNFFNFKGYVWLSGADPNFFPTILAKYSDGKYRVLLQSGASSVIERSFYVKGAVSIYVNSRNENVNSFVFSFSQKGVDSVKEYIDDSIRNLSPVLDFTKDLEKNYTDVNYIRLNIIDHTTFATGLLKVDNTLLDGTAWRNIRNLPTNGAPYLFYCAKAYIANSPSQLNEYCGVIGIKANGDKTVLLRGTMNNVQEDITMIDISAYTQISFCWVSLPQDQGWEPYFAFYKAERKLNLPVTKKPNEYISLNTTIKGGAICFLDDDIYSDALATLAPFYIKNNIKTGFAIIAQSMKDNGYTRGRIMGFYNLGMLEPMNHTDNHPSNLNVAPYATQLSQLKNCKDYLDSLGLKHTAYVSPYGNFNQDTLDVMALLGYITHYRFDTVSDSTNSVENFYNLGVHRINFGFPAGQGILPVSVAEAKILIDQAFAQNKLLVFTTHYRSNSPAFLSQLQEIIDYARVKKINILSPEDAVSRFRNIVEVDNGFRITRDGHILTDHIPLSNNDF